MMLWLLPKDAEARHISGGVMGYEYLGEGSTPSTGRYRIILRLYRDCQSGGPPLDATAAITIYPSGSNVVFRDLAVQSSPISVISLGNPGPCISNPPSVCYEVATYVTETELPLTSNGYVISYQRCCRIENISNVIGSNNSGATYTANIPGSALRSDAPLNTSPAFRGVDTFLICEDNPFQYDFGATDVDGDSLVYVFEEAYNFANPGAGGGGGGNASRTAEPPPYNSLSYTFGFSASQPMGRDVQLDPSTGLMYGIAPAAGIYVVTVCVVEYRQGIAINRHRKDLHIKVAPCSIAAADLQPEYVNCQNFTISFQNRSTSPLIRSYYWDFGVPGRNNDTSNLPRPTFTFPDTGVYRVMLITNRNDECNDTAYTLAKVFPVFNAGFRVLQTCKGVPFRFEDTSRSTFGTVDSWRWSFGYPLIGPDTSRLRNPSYTYPDNGSYQVQLIVGTSKGCRDTLDATVDVLDKPRIDLRRDTLICTGDTLQLRAVGIGTFRWSPAQTLSNPDIADPLAFPTTPTRYRVQLESAPGCATTDSVFVNVKSFVTLEAGNDTTICLTDSLRLNPRSDGLHFQWSPADSFDDPASKTPVTVPRGTATYTVLARIGRCTALDSLRVSTVAYPTVGLTPDTTLCFGDSIRLSASGGILYRWTPDIGLSSSTVPDPVARPAQSTTYRVAVRDNRGCPKPAFDTVRITILPRIRAFAGNDTSIVAGQPLRLSASGGDRYRWTPPANLDDPTSANPVATLRADTRLILQAIRGPGCYALDTVDVRVFQTPPDIFVPTAFTPNGDRLNDRLTPIPVGIASFDFFRVYNRWGQLVFSTQRSREGWDGVFRGVPQGNDTFTWQVQGRDYLGNTIYRKGTSTLIK
jgi:gliding motility-associated-like protein